MGIQCASVYWMSSPLSGKSLVFRKKTWSGESMKLTREMLVLCRVLRGHRLPGASIRVSFLPPPFRPASVNDLNQISKIVQDWQARGMAP